MPRMHITATAAAAFRDRFEPDLTADQARRTLARLAESATRLPDRTRHGQEQWLVAAPRCVLVTKQDAERLVCVTVHVDHRPAATVAAVELAEDAATQALCWQRAREEKQQRREACERARCAAEQAALEERARECAAWAMRDRGAA